ncbi:MAG TPA: GPW/gp25 family protein [Cytophagaceae bacterium]|jgi:phage baseplate assembly protein W|nr:GPW/gp25 family protein [Cytophagaceae bacterium]
MEKDKFLQITGWKFPPVFDFKSRKIVMVSEEEDIRESLEILFSTRKGERNMLPEYGCDLHKVTFDSINGDSISHLQNVIQEAIDKFESRITLENIEIDTEKKIEGLIIILIYFTINNTNKATNIAYSHYLSI